jgi:cell division transport system ATP-binding protein
MEMNIKLMGVSKIFSPDIVALDNIRLTVDRGEFVYLMGHTGSGKTSLLRTVSREILPDSGQIFVGGMNLRKMKAHDVPYFRRDLGIVAQDFKLIRSMTVYENIAFVLEAMEIPYRFVRARALKVIEQVGLIRRRNFTPEQLSGGEQQRVAIARALAKSPSLLLADEPTGNLDFYASEEIMKLLLSVNATGVTVLVATHNQYLVDSYRQRVLELQNGKIVYDGAVEGDSVDDRF